MKIKRYKVSGMTCSSCVGDIEKIMNKKLGIKVLVNFVTESMKAEYDEKIWSEEKITDAMREIGYKVN